MTGKKAAPSWLDYQPSGRRLDIEVFPFDNLRQRGTPAQIATAHRYSFYMLICVSEGAVTQLVDFEPVACRPGSLLVIHPGQVHSFGDGSGWEGWLVFFRPEFLPLVSETASGLLPTFSLDRITDHLTLSDVEFDAVTECMARMSHDTMNKAAAETLHALLRHQLCAL
ncbi:hypothetical protein CO666_31225, partial [Rhizobium chutanense]